jgi:hypothetical protein
MLKMKIHKPWEGPTEDAKLQISKDISTVEKAQYWADENIEIASSYK